MTFSQQQSAKAVVNTATIIGAGLGGLACAIALRKQGIDVQVYEQAQEFRPVGTGLTLFPNGLNSLDAIEPGIVKSLKQVSSQTHKLNLKKSTGETIMSNPVTLEEQYGQPMLNICWSRLQEILAAILPPETIHLQHRCIGFEQNRRIATAYFEAGKTVKADLLIGTDGLNSTVRQELIGDGPPRYAGRISWRATIPYRHEKLSPNEVALFTSSQGKYFMAFDVGDGYIFWSSGSLSDDGMMSSNAADAKSRVLKEFSGWAEPIQDIINATDAEQVVERPVCDRPPLASWSQGRVTLLGDAAHAMVPASGQGANTAFEDAYTLSQCLSQSSSLEAALNCYEGDRIGRTQVIQARSALQGKRSVAADSETYLRGVVDLSKMSEDEFQRWLYGYHPVLART